MLDLGTLRVGIEANAEKAVQALKTFKTNVESAEDATKKSSQEIEEATSRINDAFGKITGTAMAFGTAIAGAFAMTAKSALDAYASYEQNTGGIEKLFGTAGMSLEEYANSVGKSVDEASAEYSRLTSANDTVMQNAANAWQTAGMSANQYMEQTVKFSASLIQSLGGDTAAAADYADMAIRDMSDNVNTFGTDMGLVQQAYQGFARGNYEMLDQLAIGYGGTKSEMERLISDANALKEANGQMADLSIDSFADVVEAIHLVQEAEHVAGTTAREASTTIEGSVASAKSAWDNWLTGLGDDNANMSLLTDNLVESIVTAASNILPRLQVIAGQIIAYIPVLFEQLKASLPAEIQGIIDVIMAMLPVITGAVSGIMAIFATLQIAQKINNLITTVRLLWTVLQANPIMAVISVITMLVTAFITAYNTNEDFRNAVNSAWQAICDFVGPIIQTIVNAVTGFGQTIQNVLSTISSVIGTVISTIVSVVTGFCNTVKSVISGAFNAVKSVISTVMGAVKGVISTVLGTIKSVWQNAWNTVSNFLTGVWNNIKNGVSNGISGVVDFFKNLPSRILSALGNVGSMLLNAGKSIMQGLLNGIISGVTGIIDFVSGIGAQIAAHKGPEAYDLKLLVPNGKWIMQSLATGLKKGMPVVYDALSGITDNISDFDFGTATVDASFNAYKRLKVLEGGKGAKQNGNGTNITVNNYSPKALTERESAKQFKQSVRELALAS